MKEERFSAFYEKWVCLLHVNLQLLVGVSRDSPSKGMTFYEDLVAKLVAHHKDYYTAKWAAAHEDVLAFFFPPWLTPLENAHLWLSGWKPSTAFRLVNSLRQTRTSLPNLTEDQVKKIEELRVRIRLEEEKVEREMERHQVGMADRRMVELVRVASRVRSGGGDAEAVARVDGLVEVALKNLLGGLEKVIKMADCVRLQTLKGLLDVLSPSESVDFLAGMATMQIQMRRWGEKRESSSRGHERERGSCNCAVCLGSNNN